MKKLIQNLVKANRKDLAKQVKALFKTTAARPDIWGELASLLEKNMDKLGSFQAVAVDETKSKKDTGFFDVIDQDGDEHGTLRITFKSEPEEGSPYYLWSFEDPREVKKFEQVALLKALKDSLLKFDAELEKDQDATPVLKKLADVITNSTKKYLRLPQKELYK